MPDALHLRPRGASELVDAAFAIVRARAGALATLAGLMALPSLAQTALLVALAPAAGDPSAAVDLDALRGALFAGAYGWPATLAIALLFLGGMVFWVLCSGAALVVAARAYMGETADVGEALRVARRGLVPLLSALVQKGVLAAILMGFCLLVVVRMLLTPIIMAVGPTGGAFAAMALASLVSVAVTVLPTALLLATFSMTAPAVLLEGTPDGTRALGRSSALTSGRRWRLVGVFGVLYAVALAVGLAIQWAVALAGHGVLAEIASDVLWTLALPVDLALTAVAYYDLRIRREGLDLELLAAAPAGATPPAAPSPAAATA